MATSDGISSQDWDVIHEFAVDIVNAPDDEKPVYSKKLVDYLDNLDASTDPCPAFSRPVLITYQKTIQREKIFCLGHMDPHKRAETLRINCWSPSLWPSSI